MSNYLMPPANTLPVVYLYRDSVDFRKASLGLLAIVECELGRNPFDGELYVPRQLTWPVRIASHKIRTTYRRATSSKQMYSDLPMASRTWWFRHHLNWAPVSE